jgi:hypothetical protein
MYNLTPESLRYKWEALKFNSVELRFKELDVENARNLRVLVKRELENKAEAAAKVRQAASTPKARLNRPFGNINFPTTSNRKEAPLDRKPVISPDFFGSPIRFEASPPPKPCE